MEDASIFISEYPEFYPLSGFDYLVMARLRLATGIRPVGRTPGRPMTVVLLKGSHTSANATEEHPSAG